MSAATEFRERLERAITDPELRRLGPSLELNIDFCIGDDSVVLQLSPDRIAIADTLGGATYSDIAIAAGESAWRQVLASPPPPRFHSFTALQIANPLFEVTGDPITIAQARAVLERIIELVVDAPDETAPSCGRELRQISGQYRTVESGGQTYDIYFETAGAGVPILFLHTAGADGRQFTAQLSDVALGEQFQMFAVDLPFHGKSVPPANWDAGPYRLTSDTYRQWCASFIEQVVGEPVIVVGGSMGAAMALVLAAENPELVRGVVALEPPFKSPGRRNPFQNHVAVHGGLHNGAFVRGLMAPASPLVFRRRASWIYSQGAPGIYPGDLSFYSEEFDGSVVAPRIDARRTPVALLSGVYDYSATPEDGARLAGAIPGSLFVKMDGLGHFPMCENPDRFRPFLLQGLEFASSNADGKPKQQHQANQF